MTDFIGADTNRNLQFAYITYRYLYPRCEVKLASLTSAGILREAHPVRSYYSPESHRREQSDL